MLADAEVIATAIDVMLEFGLTKREFYIRISNRKLMESLLKSVNIPEKNFKDIVINILS